MPAASRLKVEREGWSGWSVSATAPLRFPPLGGTVGGAVEHPMPQGGARNFFGLPFFLNGRNLPDGWKSFAGAGAAHG